VEIEAVIAVIGDKVTAVATENTVNNDRITGVVNDTVTAKITSVGSIKVIIGILKQIHVEIKDVVEAAIEKVISQ
jgi:hypothetical protein